MLLQRYARRLLANEYLAAKLTRDIFEELFAQHKLSPSRQLRQSLKAAILSKCRAYNKVPAAKDAGANAHLQKNEKPNTSIPNS